MSWGGVSEGNLITLPSGSTTTNLAITATPALSLGSTNLIFILERQGSIVLTRTSLPPYAVTFTNLSPGKYFLTAALLAPETPELGDLSFDISAATLRPGNDDWGQATIFSSLNITMTGSNLHATAQANEPSPSGSLPGKSIWWAWTAGSNGVVTATTAGSSFDTVLGVYRGTNVATLVMVGDNDDAGHNVSFSQVTFLATNGTTYYFMVDSAAALAGGQAQVRLTAGAPPSIAITSPPDGYLMLVASGAVATNAFAAISLGDSAGVAGVEYWFTGGTNVDRSGILAPPYQLGLSNLFTGHYVLTVAASNNLGLVSVTNMGLSVLSLEPVLVMEGFAAPGKFQMGITGFKGPRYTLQASTNLEAWCGVNTWTNFAGAVKVADTNVVQFRQRFYRAASGP